MALFRRREPAAAKGLADRMDQAQMATKGNYATYNATAPIEVSSAGNTRHRLNLRGNRILNHAIHIAAVTQLRHDTIGRVYFDKKIAEGKTPKERSGR
jgi:transposase